MSNPFVKTVIVCACCGKAKGESNHWWILSTEFAPLCPGKLVYEVLSLDPKGKLEADEFPACGEECLNKLQSKALRGEPLC